MEKLKNIVGLIHFVIFLDNNGKRIYSKYFEKGNNGISDAASQKDFERRLGQAVLNLNVNKNNESKYNTFTQLNLVDIFNLNEFVIVCKINKDVAIFIGADQDDNECILANVLDIMEECLENITKNNMTKKSIMENYQQLALIIDEMVDEGIIINTDSESIENRVYLRDNKTVSEVSSSSSGGYFKSVREYILIIF